MKPPGHLVRSGKKKPRIDTFTVERHEGLLASLLAHLPHKRRGLVKAVLRDRQVSVDGRSVTQFDHPLAPGQCVEVRWDRTVPREQPMGLTIVYEDQDLIVVDKPSGLLTVATDKEKRRTAYAILSDYVKAADPDSKIFIIHRIDRETSGLLMFARNENIKRQVQNSWESTITRRTYLAVVEGRMDPPAGTIVSWLTESKAFTVYASQNPNQGRKAVTHYEQIRAGRAMSLLKIHLETGRKHQIRVHMQALGHPVVGDKKYGATLDPMRRIGLHARVLEFTHPITGKALRFETAIPPAFLRLFPKDATIDSAHQPMHSVGDLGDPMIRDGVGPGGKPVSPV